mgnify:CR=1 FL=1
MKTIAVVKNTFFVCILQLILYNIFNIGALVFCFIATTNILHSKQS